jgi:hypothetical protein
MIPLEANDPFYTKAIAEHRELLQLVAGVEEKLAAALGDEEAPPDWQDLLCCLEGLLAHVREHFAEEEAGGLLDEAASRLPRLGPQTTALERQHAPLLRQLCAVVNQARTSGESEKHWHEVDREFRSFCKALLAHEAAENQIAEEAFKGGVATPV